MKRLKKLNTKKYDSRHLVTVVKDLLNDIDKKDANLDDNDLERMANDITNSQEFKQIASNKEMDIYDKENEVYKIVAKYIGKL